MATTEYDKLYQDAVKATEAENVYDLIMSREKNVLESVNRVVNQKEKEHTKKSFRDTSVENVVYRVFVTLNNVITDMFSKKPMTLVFKKERRLYIGLFLVVVSILLIILFSY